MKTKANIPDAILTQLFQPMLRKGDLKKAEIIEAAIQVVFEQGFENLNFESIGKKLGIRRSHVAYHFESIDDILLKSLQYIIANNQFIQIERMKNVVSAKERFRTYLELTFDWAAALPEQMTFLVLFNLLSSYRQSWKELHLKIRQTALGRISALLIDADLTSSEEAQEKAALVQDLLTGAIMSVITIPQTNHEKAMIQKKVTTVKNILQIFNLD